MDQQNGIRIVTILGSAQPGAMTAKALELVHDELRKDKAIRLDFIEPSRLDLRPPGMGSDEAAAKALRQSIVRATGIILATPEYHGTFSSLMKIVIENLGFPSVLKGKPVGLLGVAAGAGGAIKALEHLRSVASHVGAIVLPGSVSISHVNKAFDAAGHSIDPVTERRIRGVATNLLVYLRENICPRLALEEMLRTNQS